MENNKSRCKGLTSPNELTSTRRLIGAVVSVSYAGGNYLERQNASEECGEITSRNPIARRLEYSDFEVNGLCHDAGDFCYDREYSACTPWKVKRPDSGKWFSVPKLSAPRSLGYPIQSSDQRSR